MNGLVYVCPRVKSTIKSASPSRARDGVQFTEEVVVPLYYHGVSTPRVWESIEYTLTCVVWGAVRYSVLWAGGLLPHVCTREVWVVRDGLWEGFTSLAVMVCEFMACLPGRGGFSPGVLGLWRDVCP